MQRFAGMLTIGADAITVEVGVTDDALSIDGAAGNIGTWPREHVRIDARDDGFHVRIEGEEVLLNLTEDAEFAVAMGITSASPLLRRKIAALMREE